MASWDNTQSVVEELKKDKQTEFIVIGLQRGKETNNCNVSLFVPSKKSAEIMLEVLDSVVGELFAILEKPGLVKRKRKK